MRLLAIFFFGAFSALAQNAQNTVQNTDTLLNATDGNALALRISQLMESITGHFGLVQTGANLTQSAKQDVTALQANANNAPLEFRLY